MTDLDVHADRNAQSRAGPRDARHEITRERLQLLGRSERRPVDADGVAVVTEAVEQRTDHLLLAKKRVPLVVVEVRRDEPSMMQLL